MNKAVFLFVFLFGFFLYSECQKAIFYFDKRDFKSAIYCLENRKIKDKNDYNLLGACYYLTGNYKRAEMYYLKSLAADKKFLPSLLNLSMIYFETGNINRFYDVSGRLVRYYPKNYYGYVGMAYYSYHKRDYKRAYNLLKKAKRMMPEKRDPLLSDDEFLFLNGQQLLFVG